MAIGFRLWFGLGATTNLSDAVPWGLWKILNMVAGVALSTGGFTVGFLVYVLRLERFRPLVKPAILVAFLGYGSSVFALLLDIGLPAPHLAPARHVERALVPVRGGLVRDALLHGDHASS